jgi:hypothetical protein
VGNLQKNRLMFQTTLFNSPYQHNVPVHSLSENFWDHQLALSRCATGLLDWCI